MARPLQLSAKSALVLRGQTWWFIKTVPSELREELGLTRWRHTLNTTDKQVALSRAQLFLDEVREKLLETADPASTYFKELEKLRGVSIEDTENILDTLYPELDPSDGPKFHAARRHSKGVLPPPELFTFLSVARDYLKTKGPEHEDPVMFVVKTFGADTPITSIDRKAVGDFIDTRRQTVSTGTIQINLSYGQQVYRHAQRMGIVEYSDTTPFSKWRLSQSDKQRTLPMPDDLYRALCDDLGDLRWVMVVSRLSALRPSEVVSVTLEHRSGIPVLIPQHSKTAGGRARIVPVHTSLRPIIEDILPHLTEEASRKSRKRLTNLKANGTEPFCNYPRAVNLYSCRVSAITEMSSAPDDIRRAVSGHRDVHTGYVHEFDIERLVAAIELIKSPIDDYTKL